MSEFQQVDLDGEQLSVKDAKARADIATLETDLDELDKSSVKNVSTGLTDNCIRVTKNGLAVDVPVKGLEDNLSNLQKNIDAEATRAKAAEDSNADAISKEIARAKAAEDLLAPINSPSLTGTPTAPTATKGTNTTQIATTAFVQTAVSDGIAASDALIFKGTLGTSGTITALPTTYKTGWTYRVITAGTYAGQVCEIGDLVVALVDRSDSGNLDSDWCVAQTNINGAITGIKSGDAYIATSQSGSVVKITHKDVTRSNTTSTASPSHGGTFTAVKTVTSDAKGHVTGVDTETVTLPTYGVATSSTLGLVKSGTDITVDSSGNVSVNDDSHNHVIDNVDGLQSALDGKQNIRNGTITGAVDWNTLVTPGSYKIQQSTMTSDYHAPVGEYAFGILFVIDSEGTNNEHRLMQLYFPHQPKLNYIWFRMNNSRSGYDSWTAWNGLSQNADTLDGYHASDFATASHTHSSYVNQNAFSNVTVGSTTVSADSATDTLTLEAGSNVTITPDATNDKITISSTHPTISTSADTTSTASPSAGGTFTTVDSVTRDSNGHVTKVNTKTVTIPSNSSTATTLATARTIQTNLGSTSSASFDGSADITPGVTGILPVANGGTGQTTANAAANYFINALSAVTSTPQDDDYYVSQHVGGGTLTTTYYRRPISALWKYIKSKISSVLGLTSSTYNGNSATATKATQDESGNNIKSSYASSISISDHTITLENKNGTSLGTVTVPDNNTWRPLGTTADTACAGDDARLSNARPASDVYAWAKASSKPSYTWDEIGSKPSYVDMLALKGSSSLGSKNSVGSPDGYIAEIEFASGRFTDLNVSATIYNGKHVVYPEEKGTWTPSNTVGGPADTSVYKFINSEYRKIGDIVILTTTATPTNNESKNDSLMITRESFPIAFPFGRILSTFSTNAVGNSSIGACGYGNYSFGKYEFSGASNGLTDVNVTIIYLL